MSERLYLTYLTSAVVSLEKAGCLLLFRVEAVSRITVGGKEAINLCLPNGIQLNSKASEIFWKMISFCLLIFPRGHILNSVWS